MSAATAEHVFVSVGRRKTATARIRLTKGSGKVVVNGKEPEAYFSTEEFANVALSPLRTAGLQDQVDVVAKAKGGGLHGQAGAVRLGIARALQLMDPDLRAPLKKEGHVSRDPRKRERKKSGQPGARKRFQFSKR